MAKRRTIAQGRLALCVERLADGTAHAKYSPDVKQNPSGGYVRIELESKEILMRSRRLIGFVREAVVAIALVQEALQVVSLEAAVSAWPDAIRREHCGVRPVADGVRVNAQHRGRLCGREQLGLCA